MQMGDTVFMFFCALLVWLMTPGIALFYGGLVRSKNVLSTVMHSLSSIAIVSIIWILFGYSLAFAPGNPLIGGLDWIGLQGIGFEPNADYSETIPHTLYMMFQLTFAVLTTAIISGSFAERMRFPAFILFRCSGRFSFTRRSPTGYGVEAGLTSWERSILPAATSFTSLPV